MNNTNSGDSAIAAIIIICCSPLIFFGGYTAGVSAINHTNNEIMAKELVKGCIKQPSNCKGYRDYYNAVEKYR